MKRRGTTTDAVSKAEQPIGPGDPPAPPGATDWVSDPSVNRKLDQAAAASVTAGREAARGLGGTAVFADDVKNTDAGDSLTVTIGKEIIFPVKFNGVEVGPLSMTVRIRVGETAGQAYTRARIVLEHLFETEFAVRIKDFIAHVDEARKQARPE